ncbi:hypothetical protein GCM10017620_16250 [Brevundimonas intermedia]|uniref:DUF6250 domain-containing protein n=1 Tax=Brevundimonas intermedia TaxID=74315 RepID=A0ABQ5T798_9CAUL|nr:DUF6250 domain-containing protein [Brevundimonas intermedia]GLK48652.1 hypothetical protein GCM10017620_16250 [Brevundimonas intermedia]
MRTGQAPPRGWSRRSALAAGISGAGLGLTGVGAVSGCASIPVGGRSDAGRLYADDFRQGLTSWLIEREDGLGKVWAADGAMWFDTPRGATAWFRQRLTSPVEISFTARAISAGGPNDRVSDLNCFWMATDPRSPEDLIALPRSGAFADYDLLRTYYVGLGGNGNTTSRFRRYAGNGQRPLLAHHDLSAPEDLIAPNRPYRIRLIADASHIEYWRDDRRMFALEDPQPYREGWFGLRTTFNHMAVRDFEVRTRAGSTPPGSTT